MRRRVTRHKTFLFGYAILGALLLAMFIACASLSLKVKAGTSKEPSEKIVSAVSVKEGDTIWSIAADFYTDEYTDISELVDEIKKCNNISDHICIGQKLFIPHYIYD